MSCVLFLWSFSINLRTLALENYEQFLYLLNIKISFLLCKFIGKNKLKICPVLKKDIPKLKRLGNWLNTFKVIEMINALLQVVEAFDVVLQLKPCSTTFFKGLYQWLGIQDFFWFDHIASNSFDLCCDSGIFILFLKVLIFHNVVWWLRQIWESWECTRCGSSWITAKLRG